MKRHISIIIFVTLFISAVSIIAIIVAKGYTIKEDEIRESGILDIESTPAGGIINIDGIAKETTPKKIELVAGTYEVSIAKDGYKTWKKELTVEPAVVSSVAATLIPSTLEVEQATFVEVEKAFFSDDGNTALYTVSKKTNQGIWLIPLEKSIFSLSDTKPTKIGKMNLIPEECQDNMSYNFSISNDNKNALLSCNTKSFKVFKLINLENSEEDVININQIIGFSPTDVSFKHGSENLIISDEQIVSSYSLGSKEFRLIARENAAFAPQLVSNGSTLFLLRNSYDNKSRNLFKINEYFQITEIKTNISLDMIKQISGPASEETNVLAFTGKKGSLIVYENDFENPIKFSENQVEFLKWSFDGVHFLYIEKNTLKSALIREMPNKSIRIDTYNLAKNYSNLKLSFDWSRESNQLVVEDQTKNALYSYDFDGQNKTLLFSGKLAHPGSFKLSVNETFLVILLKDSKESSNLYTVKLKI